MKKFFFLSLASFIAFATPGFAQSSSQTLDVVSWNVEWFGATNQAPSDDNLQETNVKKILRYLNADIYGLVEIVDTTRLRRLRDSLGSNYKFAISDFCSGNTTGTGNSWLTGQKLAYIYNSNIFSNVTTRGMLRSSASAYSNYASGRFPYLLNADVTINGTSRNINFILLHGKAGSGPTDYDKRFFASKELKDTLDTYYSSAINIIFGDFNDALHTTICSGCSSNASSYRDFVNDSTDADHYKSISLALGAAGQSSMINFPNVVDNHVISNEAHSYYLRGSVSVRTDVTNPVPDFLNHNTSDHYPVFSQYNLSGITTHLQQVSLSEFGVKIFPNPFHQQVSVKISKPLKKVRMELSDVTGRLVWFAYYDKLENGDHILPKLPSLQSGNYYLSLNDEKSKTTIKLSHLQ